MREELAIQIAELQQVHKGLTAIAETEKGTILSGTLPFEASADGHSPITECFEIDLIIPDNYSKSLPRVRETGGKMDSNYDHIYEDGTLCLAVPIEERRLFSDQPTLLGFINKLVIPYFFGYWHWKTHGTHPFDEAEHGAEGIVQHYMDTLELSDELAALAVISFLYEHGYRGHHPCPCGSGLRVRKCHGPMLRDLHQHHTRQTLMLDFEAVFGICFKKFKDGELSFPKSLKIQILRILKNGQKIQALPEHRTG